MHDDVKHPRATREPGSTAVQYPNSVYKVKIHALSHYSNALNLTPTLPQSIHFDTEIRNLQPTMAPNDNFISRGIQSGVAAAGSFAGGVVDSAGKTVQSTGRGVGNSFVSPILHLIRQSEPSVLPPSPPRPPPITQHPAIGATANPPRTGQGNQHDQQLG